MGTWHGDADDAAARHLAEHGMVVRLDGDELVIEAGNEALPPWPPNETDPQAVSRGLMPEGLSDRPAVVETADSTGGDPETTPVTLCAVCATPVVRHGDAGWRHEVSYRARGGCSTPWPEG